MVRLSVSACCAAAGAKLPFDLESSNQLSQRAEEPEQPDHLLCMAVARLFGVEESGRCLAGNEFDSRQSALSAFSPLILIVRWTDRAPPSFSFLSFLCRRRRFFLGMGIHRFTYWTTVAENTIFPRSGFRFASSNADVAPLLRLLNGWDGGAIIFRRGFIFPLPSRCDIAPVRGIMIGARWESLSLHLKISA